MSRWYRAYEGTVTDAKLGEAALVAGCSRSVAIAAWHCILESCATANDRGRFDITPRRCAVILQEPVNVIEAAFTEMQSLGMIEGDTVCSWQKRQFESDSSTERSRKHREAKRNADATLQQRDATPPYTETDTDTEVNLKKARGARITDDWVPDDASERKAAELGFTGHDLRTEIERFKNYWIAKSGAGAVKLDWQRTFQNWLINASKFQTSRRNVIGLDQRNRDDFKARKEREEWEIFQRHLVK